MHLRPPSIDQGVQAGLWAAFFGLYILLGSLAVGVDKSTVFVVAPIAAGAIFLFVRLRGGAQLRR